MVPQPRDLPRMPDPFVEATYRLHAGLPRQAPGSDACTRDALRRLPPLPKTPVVVDLGCGPGRATLVLAEELGTRVVAVDLHEPFLDELRARARAGGLGHLVEARQGDMAALDLAPGSIDLIWSEGAIYNIGFAAGLALWRPLLRPRGLVVLSECAWLTENRPEEAIAFWRDAYPEMTGIDENARAAAAAGYEVLDWFVLPSSAWWDEYYTPLSHRAAQLRPGADAPLLATIEATEREVDLYRRHGHSYGYVFYLLRRSD